MDSKQMTSIFDTINATLDKIKVNDITENSSARTSIPAGYYFCKVDSEPEFHVSPENKPSVKIVFRTMNDGVNLDNTEVLTGTKDKLEYKYFSLNDEQNAKRFISDMMKFRIGSKGEALPAETFKNAEVMMQALQLLKDKCIFIMVSESEGKPDASGKATTSRWVNLITFDRATELGLSEK